MARLVAERRPDLEVVEHEREPSDLLELWAARERVVVIDAVAGDVPGRVHRFDASELELPVAFDRPASSHALGLGSVIALARSLARLPGRLVVFGIEGTSFAAGAELTAPVGAAVEEVAALVAGELAAGGSVGADGPGRR